MVDIDHEARVRTVDRLQNVDRSGERLHARDRDIFQLNGQPVLFRQIAEFRESVQVIVPLPGPDAAQDVLSAELDSRRHGGFVLPDIHPVEYSGQFNVQKPDSRFGEDVLRFLHQLFVLGQIVIRFAGKPHVDLPHADVIVSAVCGDPGYFRRGRLENCQLRKGKSERHDRARLRHFDWGRGIPKSAGENFAPPAS